MGRAIRPGRLQCDPDDEDGSSTDVVRVARQMGHARPSITLDIYAHEFEEARGTDDIAARLRPRLLCSPPSDQI